MATAKYTLTSSWQLVAASTVDFLVENASTYPVRITFSASAPAADAPYHILQAGEALTRMNLRDALYARADSALVTTSSVVVSTS